MTLTKKITVEIEVLELIGPNWTQKQITELLQTPNLSTQHLIDLVCLLRMATGAAASDTL